jgi:hypothetical protein
MYANDITNITPPTTLADLAALDATREIPYLKARCNRIGIQIPNANPPPHEIIPHLERRLAEHNKRGAMFLSDRSGDYCEWKAIKEGLEEFLSYLRTLSCSFSSFPSVSSPSQRPHETERKPNQIRTENEPSSQPAANQQSQSNQNRTENESHPNHAGHDSESSAQHASKQAENDEFDEEEKELEAIKALIPKIDNSYDAAKLAIRAGLLPDPAKCGESKYRLAFFDLFGPPRRSRLDNAHPDVKTFIVGLLEELSLQRVQDRLICPPPIGAYILTSKSALRRFRIREHTREAKRNQRALRKQIAELQFEPDNSNADFTVVSEKLLKLRLVESSLHPDPDLAQTKTLIEMLEKIRAGKIAERKIALAEHKQK